MLPREAGRRRSPPRGAARASTRADSSAVHSGLSGEMAAPARHTPSATTGHHARLGIVTATRSPGRTPRCAQAGGEGGRARGQLAARQRLAGGAVDDRDRAAGSAAAWRSAAIGDGRLDGGRRQRAAMDGRGDGRHACVPPDISQQRFVSGNVTAFRYAVNPWDARRSTTRPRASGCWTRPSASRPRTDGRRSPCAGSPRRPAPARARVYALFASKEGLEQALHEAMFTRLRDLLQARERSDDPRQRHRPSSRSPTATGPWSARSATPWPCTASSASAGGRAPTRASPCRARRSASCATRCSAATTPGCCSAIATRRRS